VVDALIRALSRASMLNNSRYLGVMRLQVLSAGLPSYAIIDIFGVVAL
jgi:hypothetical protein